MFTREDVQKYAEAHTEQVKTGVLQFLSHFKCACGPVLEFLSEWKQADLEMKRVAAVEAGRRRGVGPLPGRDKSKKRKPNQNTYSEPPAPKVCVGICPRCGQDLLGRPQPMCSKQEGSRFGKRVFYKECSSCTYYSEVFQQRPKKHVEVEGG